MVFVRLVVMLLALGTSLSAQSFAYEGVWSRVDANGDGQRNENWVYQLSFTTTAPTTITFDMLAGERGRNPSTATRDWNGDGRLTVVDTYLMLFPRNNGGNITGNVLVQNNNKGNTNDGNGSVDIYDSYLTLTNLVAGNYVLAIGQYVTTQNRNMSSNEARNGWQPWQVDNNTPWRLDVSANRNLTNLSIIPTANLIPAPEPHLWALLILAAGAATWWRQRSSSFLLQLR